MCRTGELNQKSNRDGYKKNLPRVNISFTLKLAKVHFYYASFLIPYFNNYYVCFIFSQVYKFFAALSCDFISCSFVIPLQAKRVGEFIHICYFFPQQRDVKGLVHNLCTSRNVMGLVS